jgi:hypothetical protein
MTVPLLESLKSEEFNDAVGFVLPPPALRQQLRAMKEVQRLRTVLESGDLSEETLRDFVSSLMRELRQGERFPHELALAALAVVLESRPTAFAEEFLHGLARLQLAEMVHAPRVAVECLKHRVSLTDKLRDGSAPAATR